MQAHHVEIRSADDAGANLVRLAESDHGEADGGEVAERAQSLHARAQILNLGNGKRRVVRADAERALADVDQPVLIAVHQRPQQNAPHQREDGRVGADAEGQRQHHGNRQPFTACE